MATFNKETKIWSNPPIQPLFNPNANLGRLMLSSLYTAGNRVVQIEAETCAEITAAEIRKLTIRAAHNLRSLDIVEGDVVSIATRIRNTIPSIVFASLLLGAPISTMDPEFQIEDFRSILNQTKPKIIFCESTNLVEIKKALQKLSHTSILYTVDRKVDGIRFVDEIFVPNGDDLNFPIEDVVDPDNYLAFIVCSSGTTGTSKGISISHKTMILTIQQNVKIVEEEICLLTGSLYWISNVSFLLISTVMGDQRIVSINKFNVEKVLEYIKKYKINFLATSPHRLSSIVKLPRKKLEKFNLSSIKVFVAFGSTLTEGLKSNMNELFPAIPLVTAYGTSEVSRVTHMVANYAPEFAVGDVQPGCEVKIIDSSGDALDNGKQGEVLLRKNSMFNGYYNDPENTRKAVDNDGWFHTGDIGYFDENGCLFIIDRLKDMFFYKGFTIIPSPLEDKITSMKGVKQAVVVGIPIGFELDDALPAAVVVKSDINSAVTEEDIKAIIKDNFRDPNQLRGGVYFIDKLPETPSGKLQRKLIKNIAIDLYNAKQKKLKETSKL